MKLSAVLPLVVALSACTASLRAEPPPYLLLRTPPSPAPHHPTYSRYPGKPHEVSTHSYSYGWFGAQPRQHWSRHFGYYRNYTQWSAK